METAVFRQNLLQVVALSIFPWDEPSKCQFGEDSVLSGISQPLPAQPGSFQGECGLLMANANLMLVFYYVLRRKN